MAKEVASIMVHCGWQPLPVTAPTVRLSPSVVEMKKGRTTYKVYVDVYDGERLVPYSDVTFGPLGSGAPGALVDGVRWSFGNEDNRFYYLFTYLGSTDVNVDIPYSVTYNGVKYPGIIPLRSVADGKDGESITGPTGPVGPNSPPTQFWDDYPDGYEFQDGSEGCTRKDSVYHGMTADGLVIAYECIKTHTKGNLKNSSGNKIDDTPDANCNEFPPNSSNRVWKRGQSFNLVATNVILALNAYIKLLSSNGIRIYNSGGQIVGQMAALDGAPSSDNILLPFFIGGVMGENGVFSQSPLFAVDSSGRTYHGGTDGQHIEIDPVTRRLLVYGSDGKVCAVHSGEDIDYTEVGAATLGAATTKAANEIKNTLNGSETKYTNIVADAVAPGAGTLEIQVPEFVVSTLGNYPTGTGLISSFSAELHLEVLIGGKLTKSYSLGHVGAPPGSATTAAKTLGGVSVPRGKTYTVRLRYTSGLAAGGTATFSTTGQAKVTLNVLNRECHYGRNGWYVSTGNQNYAYCIFDSNGKLHFKIVVNGNPIIDSDA